MPRAASPPLSGSALLIGLCAYAACLLLAFGFGMVAGARSGRSPEATKADAPPPADPPKPVEIKPTDDSKDERVAALQRPKAEPPAPTPKQEPPKKEPPKTLAPKPEPPKPTPPKAEPPKPPPPKKEPPKTDPPPATNVTFARDVLPVFRSHCLTCHGIPKIEGGFDVRTLAAIMKGGENGEVLKPGDPAKSVLWIQIEENAMPPAGKPRMTAAEKQLVKDWIAGGAK